MQVECQTKEVVVPDWVGHVFGYSPGSATETQVCQLFSQDSILDMINHEEEYRNMINTMKRLDPDRREDAMRRLNTDDSEGSRIIDELMALESTPDLTRLRTEQLDEFEPDSGPLNRTASLLLERTFRQVKRPASNE